MSDMDTNPDVVALPAQPIDELLGPIRRFMHAEAASGIVLLLATAVALTLANMAASSAFLSLWQTPVGIAIGSFEFRHSLKHLINDGAMVIFFFVVGLEIKREMVLGELRDIRRAALPIAAALGGMVVPAGIYLFFQAGEPGERGWGIPMATDIAFVVGCLAVLGSRVPHGLRIMLLTLAIADDVGAILVIAIGYSGHLHPRWLLGGMAGLALVFLTGRLGVRRFKPYIVLGVFVWFAIHESGIHATIAGVILGLMTPARSQLKAEMAGTLLDRARSVFQTERWRDLPHRAGQIHRLQCLSREAVSPVEYLIDRLHPWVSFVIMPVFALANAGVPFHVDDVASPIAIAVLCGLFLGKSVGIALASYAVVKAGVARLPEAVAWPQMIGGAVLSGIGFTMALFIASLALQGPMLNMAKVGILAGSLLSAIMGITVLFVATKRVPRA